MATNYLSTLFNKIFASSKTQTTNKEIDDYWSVTRAREGEVYASCEPGALFEATHQIEAHYHTGFNNWMDTQYIQPETKFIVYEYPQMNEFGMYTVTVLVDGTKALIDLCELHDKFKVVG